MSSESAANLAARAPRRRLPDSRVLTLAAGAAAIVLTAASVLLGTSPKLSGPLGPASPLVLTLLGASLLLTLALGASLAWRLISLMSAQSSDAGARLHLRFVTLFALAAVAPAVIVALFFGVLVTRGVENWFSERVQTVMKNSAKVANSYIEEQNNYLSAHVDQMARQLNTAAPTLADSPIAFGSFLADQASDNGFSAAYLIDAHGRVLARAEAPDAPALVVPPPSTFKVADDGDISARPFESADLFRALYRLKGYPEAYLYVVRPLDRGIFSHLRETEASLAAYDEAKRNRARIQAAFVLTYVETALLVLVGAVWLGISAANGIAAPVARLVQAAGRVSAGDLTARVESDQDPEEIAVLSRAFNRMTGDLQTQQEALRTAHVDAESRRQFIETVLLGVSAGVIGLDVTGRVSAVNNQATRLLRLEAGDTFGRTLAEIAPELAPVADRAHRLGAEAEQELDVVRGGESLRLRIRASHSAEGMVLTFDDITRLVSAQRNAAWKDVARRIAHEIKNPLTPILLSAERLRRKYRREIGSDLETFDRCTETIIRQVGDIGRMVDEFSSFARMPAPRFEAHDGAELLRQAVFAQRVAAPDITVDLEEPLAATPFTCDARMVAQALANVLKNASEAIAGRQVKSPEPPGHIRVRLIADGSHVAFDIEDNGLGLPAKDRDRLTEPYVTTREKGTGLGLAIVKRILEEHGGELILTDATQGTGARVILRFSQSESVKRPAAAELTAV